MEAEQGLRSLTGGPRGPGAGRTRAATRLGHTRGPGSSWMTEDTPTSGAATQNEDDPEHGRGASILDAVERAFAIEHEEPHGILRIEEGPPPGAPPPLRQPAPAGDL